MEWLFTTLSTVVMLIACVAAVSSRNAMDHAQREGKRLGALRARVLSMEAQIEALTHQHKKLSGRFYASLVEREPEIEATPAPAGDVCQNWVDAKRSGPRSEPASCECDYCTAQRMQRARARAELVPKSQPDRIAEMRRGMAQP